jgi:hypothetical protein
MRQVDVVIVNCIFIVYPLLIHADAALIMHSISLSSFATVYK